MDKLEPVIERLFQKEKNRYNQHTPPQAAGHVVLKRRLHSGFNTFFNRGKPRGKLNRAANAAKVPLLIKPLSTNQKMFNDCIIMAGGSGTRLWPASTASKPKQFLNLPSAEEKPAGEKKTGESFFISAVRKALAVTADTGSGNVIIIAGKNHTNAIVEECAKLGKQERERLLLIPEPLARNTAPAIACALLYIDWAAAGQERNILVLTSDHIISPMETFKADANAAASMAQTDKLVVFGIPPLGPETGYGYIETSGTLTIKNGDTKNPPGYAPEVFSAASFREKPDIVTAREFIKQGKFYWNSGMFAFSSKFMLAEYRRSSPEVIAPFNELWTPNQLSCRTKNGLRILEELENLEAAYSKTRSISFDYAIAEKCNSVVMVKAGFSWTDVGSWDEYANLVRTAGAEIYGNEKSIETCFVDSDIPVALCEVEDLIVVIRAGKEGRPPVALISKKGKTQAVKEIVEQIKSKGRTELL